MYYYSVEKQPGYIKHVWIVQRKEMHLWKYRYEYNHVEKMIFTRLREIEGN